MTGRTAYNYLIYFPGDGYYRELFREADDRGDAAFLPWSSSEILLRRLSGSGSLPPLIRKLFFRAFCGKLVRRFRKEARGMRDPGRPVCVIVNVIPLYMLARGLYGALQKAFPGAKAVAVVMDLISLHDRLEKIVLQNGTNRCSDLIYSFDPAEAEKYGIPFHNVPFPVSYKGTVPAEEECDLFFFGRNKDRLDFVRDVRDNMTARGYRCSFSLTDVQATQREKAGDGIRISDWIPYEEYLRREAGSRVLLEVRQNGSTGNTLRVYEAVMLGKKLISNNPYLKTNPAFDPENMFVFEKPEDIPDEFMRSPARPYSRELKEAISLAAFLKDVEEDLNKAETKPA